MSVDTNKAVVRRLIEEVWSAGNLAVADELCTVDYVSHDPSHPASPPGPAGLRHVVALFRTGFPDLHLAIEDMRAAEGETVVTRWTARGTHRGPLLAIPPTGYQAAIGGLTLSRLEGDRVAEEWPFWDMLGLMLQLGVLPRPAQGTR